MPRKLKPGEPDMIRLLYKTTSATQVALAREYKVHPDTIGNVIAGRTHNGKPPKPRADRKYTDEQVLEVRRLRRETQMGARKICQAMGLPQGDRGCIEQILRGETYQDVT